MTKQKEQPTKGNKTQELAYQMYEGGEYNQVEIAELLGVDNKTVTAWKQKYNWDERRQAAKQTANEIIKKLEKALSDELDRETINADNISKLTVSIERLKNKKILASQAISILSSYMSYLILLGKQDVAKLVAETSPSFINHLLDHD